MRVRVDHATRSLVTDCHFEHGPQVCVTCLRYSFSICTTGLEAQCPRSCLKP